MPGFIPHWQARLDLRVNRKPIFVCRVRFQKSVFKGDQYTVGYSRPPGQVVYSDNILRLRDAVSCARNSTFRRGCIAKSREALL